MSEKISLDSSAIFYFWGLYDKLPEKTLTVNKIII